MREPDDGLLISEDASLFVAMERLERCTSAFTVFATDSSLRVTGVLTRGDVLRCLMANHRESGKPIDELVISDAMVRPPEKPGGHGMLYIEQHGTETWYEQLTKIRADNRLRWHRIKLIPVLDEEFRLVNILDLESPRTRARLETVVMAETFKMKKPQKLITDSLVARRRAEFDEIHHGSHRRKVAALCELLLSEAGGGFPMLEAIFNAARADEVFKSLADSEEWLRGHVSTADMTKKDQRALIEKLRTARTGLETFYLRAGTGTPRWFPSTADRAVLEQPQIIIVLGCEGDDALCGRASAAVSVIRQMSCQTTTMVLSGGGFGHEKSEASRLCEEIKKQCLLHDSAATLNPHLDRKGWFTLRTRNKSVDIALEEDSMDTLGNAVFSWFTLRLAGPEYGLRASDDPRLQRLVLVTDAIHAPRSHDIFRRVFAFRSSSPRLEEGPQIVVKTVDRTATLTKDERDKAISNLASEAQTNLEIFRLLNPLTSEFDVIENGHVRSILGQMIRLHKYYQGRWDLVRKYRICWTDEPA